MSQTLIAVLLSFLGYSFLNVGQAGQKIGLDKRGRNPVVGWSIWLLATAGTGVSFFLIFTAILLGSVSITGAMAGTGLVSLAIFSRVVLKEKLSGRTVMAILAIVVAAAVIGIFDVQNEPKLRKEWLLILLAAGIVAYSTAILLVPKGSLRGIFIGGLAGFLGAYSQLFQRYSTTDISLKNGFSSLLRHIISSPVTLVWIALSFVSMVVLQFSYREAETVRIVPVFTANFIVVPVLGAVIIFSEVLSVPQWIAVAVMVAASVILGRQNDSGTTGIEEKD